ncbi:nuclear transport factor 2 [Staphylotrichum tortipilum]|uniref:Nuclear transport factor 2 n=1 Tax=Staphylotrichum tortipilum TaxID=2831512 RepID=A0AAN6MKN9_9PEZI|nr:nuclear transport factor 2 [Staphylotrichum longicolle]
MADFQGIAKQFVTHYYLTFDRDRKDLVGLYRENSMLTFESAQSLGAQSITEKLVSLPFQKVQHQAGEPDAQPTPNGGIIILVTGQLVVDDESRPLPYSQAFQLCQDANGQWFIFNDVFKLVLG